MEDMTTAEGQLAAARQRRLPIVTVLSTGERGWVTQEQNYGFHYMVRIAGARGSRAVRRFKVDEIEFDPGQGTRNR